MSDITITEGLAELKLIKAKVEKKKQFMVGFLCRQEGVKDPLEKQGGSVAALKAERQSISDLLNRFVKIRSAIADANAKTQLTINDVTRTVADWLVWKRDIAPVVKDVQNNLAAVINANRNEGRKKGLNVVSEGQAQRPDDIIVNIDEKELSEESEKTIETLGVLDGKLSLHNATVKISV